MVTCLSTSTSLRLFSPEFESPTPRHVQESRRPSPPARTLLPALTQLSFQGVSEYLEDLVARIDAPLFYLRIKFFDQLIFDNPQVAQYISRTPTLYVRDEVHVSFSDSRVGVALPRPPWTHPVEGLILRTPCKQSGLPLPSLTRLCRSSLLLRVISSLEQLYIRENKQLQLHWQDYIERSQSLELLHPFTAMKDLYLSREFAPPIAAALQEDLSREPLGFIAARQLSYHPIAVSLWSRIGDESVFGAL